MTVESFSKKHTSIQDFPGYHKAGSKGPGWARKGISLFNLHWGHYSSLKPTQFYSKKCLQYGLYSTLDYTMNDWDSATPYYPNILITVNPDKVYDDNSVTDNQDENLKKYWSKLWGIRGRFSRKTITERWKIEAGPHASLLPLKVQELDKSASVSCWIERRHRVVASQFQGIMNQRDLQYSEMWSQRMENMAFQDIFPVLGSLSDQASFLKFFSLVLGWHHS